MINITIVKKNNNITKIEAVGHSGYAESGSDIVCSAVSTLLESLINGLTEIVKIDAIYHIDEDTPSLMVQLPDNLDASKLRESEILMQSTVLGLKAVGDGYSKFIKIKEKQDD